MNAWLKRFALSFIVTLGFAVGRLPAQAPLVPASQPFDSSPSAPLISLLSRPQLPPAMSLTPKLNQHGYCCDSDLNWYGCGGVRAQLDFYFGSCRTFFGEPCLPPQPNHPALQKHMRPLN